jgi:hypothetical protein
MTVSEVLDQARAFGVELEARGDRLHWRCRGPLPEDLRALLRANKNEVLAVLREQTCPECHRRLDFKYRCWHCGYRRCENCGKETGSELIRLCVVCGNTSVD